jgi:DNA processing protein
MSAPQACDACLARTWLIARLAGAIEIARHRKRRLREILALPGDELVAALAREDAAAVAAELATLEVDALREATTAASLDAVCRHGDLYPSRLLDLDDAPAVLFVAGGVDRLDELAGAGLDDGPRAIAVVGTRRASPDGLEIARVLGRGLSATGVTLVSGMALGIDSASHGGAVQAGGRTIAVLACGADLAYPPSKARLRDQIVAGGGCVISELPPGFRPMKWCFPARNRVIAALSHMTIVVEAARRSGSLITAEIASDLGREVGAVPGSVMSWRAAGTNALLRDGASLVRDVRDVLDIAVGVGPDDGEPPLHLTPHLRAIFAEVAGGRDTLAALAGAAGAGSVGETLAALTELELLGHLRRGPGGRYVVIPS